MTETLSGPTITVTPVARDIAHSLLAGSVFTLLLSPVNYLLAAGMLPDRLRRDYGLRWNFATRALYRALVTSVRASVRVMPADWRAMPMARRAKRRCG